MALAVSCLLFSAQFSQATSKLCGFQCQTLKKRRAYQQHHWLCLPLEKSEPAFNNLLSNIKERTGQKVQGISQAFTVPPPVTVRISIPCKDVTHSPEFAHYNLLILSSLFLAASPLGDNSRHFFAARLEHSSL